MKYKNKIKIIFLPRFHRLFAQIIFRPEEVKLESSKKKRFKNVESQQNVVRFSFASFSSPEIILNALVGSPAGRSMVLFSSWASG